MALDTQRRNAARAWGWAKRKRTLPLDIGGRLVSSAWEPRSRLFLVADAAGWVLSEEMTALAGVARRLGVRLAPDRLAPFTSNQCAFYASHFMLLGGALDRPRHRVATAYMHGRPGTPGSPEFDIPYETLRRFHSSIDRVQVTHSEIEDVVLSTGIDPAKVFPIRIGLDPALFSPATREERRRVRERFDIPESAFVVGSFQKDGVGWGSGDEPKLIKGPDVLVRVLERVHARIPELFVFLSGPARGYVKRGLQEAGIPFRHVYLEEYAGVGDLYHALDAYLVASRQEGGPKAVLESMASRVPLVTTRVGQAMDLVRHGQNAWMVDAEDDEGLAHWLEHVARAGAELDSVLSAGEQTALENTHARQVPLWREFMTGFVRFPASNGA